MQQLLSILIPVYNEERNIQELLSRVAAVALPYDVRKELIIVDDGSSDDTFRKAQAWIAQQTIPERVLLLRHERNHGKGAGIRTALQKAKGDYVIIQDGDLELDPQDISTLLGHMISHNLKVVYGSRFLQEKGRHLYRSFYLGGRLVSLAANLLYGQHITDEPTCYKLFRREVLDKMRLRCEGFEFCPEVTAKTAKQGIKIEEIPIRYTPRTMAEGKKLRWKDGLKALWTLLKYRFTD